MLIREDAKMEKTATDKSLCVVLCTAPSHEVAVSIANTLVEEHLAACATIIGNATSIYRWQGEKIMEQEVQLILKTCANIVTQLQQRFTSLHPFSVPEFFAIPITEAYGPYADWISGEVKQ
jgi:periplasmic divalent cation tolerance protein